MDIDFSRLNNLGRGRVPEEAPQAAEPQEPNVFAKCWDMLERFYNIEYDNDNAWTELIDLSEAIYQREKERAGGTMPEAYKEMILDTISFIEKVATHRHEHN